MVGTLDYQVIEKFEQFKGKTGKYSDLDIKDVGFELKNIFEIVSLSNGSEFPSGYVRRKDIQGDIPLISAGTKVDIMGNIQSLKGNYSVYPEKHYVFNNTKNKWNEVTHYIGQDYYTLTADGVYGGTLILRKEEDYPNGFYTTNVCKVLNFINENVFEKYFLNAYKIEKEKHKFGFITKANNDNLKKVFIPIPLDYNEQYKSIDIQKVIVEFLEYSFDNLEQIKKNIDKRYDIVIKMKKSLIPSTFKRTAIKNTFKKYAQENNIDFDITDINFNDDNTFGNIFEFNGGSSKYTKPYYTNPKNKGDYPLLTGSTNIVEFIKPINQNDVNNAPAISYNKDNDKGSVAFFHNRPFIVGGHHYLLKLQDTFLEVIDLKYSYHLLTEHFSKNMYYQSKEPRANSSVIKDVKFLIPESLQGFSSIEIQEILANFIEYMDKEIDEKYFKKYNRFYEVIELLRETYLKRTFSKIVWS